MTRKPAHLIIITALYSFLQFTNYGTQLLQWLIGRHVPAPMLDLAKLAARITLWFFVAKFLLRFAKAIIGLFTAATKAIDRMCAWLRIRAIHKLRTLLAWLDYDPPMA